MKTLAAVLVVLAVVGVGRAGEKDIRKALEEDQAIIEELSKAGVNFDGKLFFAHFDDVRGTDTLVGRLADLSDQERLANMHVRLRGSDITDAGLAAIGCRFKAVGRLTLSGTAVTDAGLKNLVGLRVRSLYLQDCAGVTDAGVASIVRLKGLWSVTLSGTRVTDAGLERLAALSDLEHLTLDGTAVTDEGLRHLERLSRLEYLALDKCPNITEMFRPHYPSSGMACTTGGGRPRDQRSRSAAAGAVVPGTLRRTPTGEYHVPSPRAQLLPPRPRSRPSFAQPAGSTLAGASRRRGVRKS